MKNTKNTVPFLIIVILGLQTVSGQSWLTEFTGVDLDPLTGLPLDGFPSQGDIDPLTGLPLDIAVTGGTGIPDPSNSIVPDSGVIPDNRVIPNTDTNTGSVPNSGATNNVIKNSDKTNDVKPGSRNVVILPKDAQTKNKPKDPLPGSTKDTTDTNSITGVDKQKDKIDAPLPDVALDPGQTEPIIWLDPFTGLPVEGPDSVLPPVDTLSTDQSGQSSDASQIIQPLPDLLTAFDQNLPADPTRPADPVSNDFAHGAATDTVDIGFPGEKTVNAGDSKPRQGADTGNLKPTQTIPGKRFNSILDIISKSNPRQTDGSFPDTSANVPDSSAGTGSIPDTGVIETSIGGQTDAFREIPNKRVDSSSPLDQSLDTQPLVPGHVSGEQTGTQPLTDAEFQAVAKDMLNSYGGGRSMRNAYKAMRKRGRQGRGKYNRNKNGRNNRRNNRRSNRIINKNTGGSNRNSGLVKIPGLGLLDTGTGTTGVNPRRRPPSRGKPFRQHDMGTEYRGGKPRHSGLVTVPGLGLLDLGTETSGGNQRRRTPSRGRVRPENIRSILSDTSRYIGRGQ